MKNDLQTIIGRIRREEHPHPARKQAAIRALGASFAARPHTVGMSPIRRLLFTAAILSPSFWLIEGAAALTLLFVLTDWGSGEQAVRTMLAEVSALAAGAAVLGIPEILRPVTGRMWELEQSCRINSRQLMSARMVLVAGLDLALFTLIALALGGKAGVEVWRVMLYLLTPFTFCALLFFAAFRLLHNRMAVWLLAALDGGMALGVRVLADTMLYEPAAAGIWAAVLAAELILLVPLTGRILTKLSEEGAKWSLYSIT